MFEGCTSGQEEQKLEWGEAHRSFQELFELHMEQFLATQSLSAEEFVAACQVHRATLTYSQCCGSLLHLRLTLLFTACRRPSLLLPPPTTPAAAAASRMPLTTAPGPTAKV